MSKALRSIPFFVAASLFVSFVSMLWFRTLFVQVFLYAVLCGCAFAIVYLGSVRSHDVKRTLLLVLPFLIFMTVSQLINYDRSDSFFINAIKIGSVWCSFFTLAFVANSQPDLVESLMQSTAILCVPILVYVLIFKGDAYLFGRWVPFYDGDTSGAHPNWWGLICLGVAWCVCRLKSNILKMVCFSVVCLFMYLVQSRGAIVSLVPVVLFSSGLFFPLTPKRIVFFSAILMLAIVLILFGVDFGMIDFFSEKVLLLDDPLRGIGSGMTGRVKAYKLIWEALDKHPYFGGGAERYFAMHNGYLFTLASSGMFAFLAMMFFLFKRTYDFICLRDYFNLGCVLSYEVLLMTYPRTFNANLTSLLFILLLMENKKRSG